MNNPQISIEPIVNLLADTEGHPRQFLIPSYQRGYRWNRLQVRHLLDDIWNFAQSTSQSPKERFYCLQPIVIKTRENDQLEVVDGQQRLTTVFLILKWFRKQGQGFNEPSFEIIYETRGDTTGSFLNEINMDRRDENVDYYHLCEAYLTIEECLEKLPWTHRNKFLQHLLSDDEIGHNVKVIWYQLPDQDNPIEAFARLNVGKIPLTNDELIRALFLSRKESNPNHDAVSLKIAYEWDLLEKSLQSDSFWYFFNNERDPINNERDLMQNRIGFLFKLVAQSYAQPGELGGDDFGVFYVFNRIVRNSEPSLEELWLEIKQTFMLLEEWYQDRILYHIVGFLIQQNFSIRKLQNYSKDCTKSAFRSKLKEKIFRRTVGGTKLSDLSKTELSEFVKGHLDELEYGRKSHDIKQVLILFNIATLLENEKSTQRFEFDYFKRQDTWDIEHIRSTADKPERPHLQREWLEYCKIYFEAHEPVIEHASEREREGQFLEKIEQFLTMQDVEVQDKFESLYDEILDYFGESNVDEAVDNISNLTLLDSITNRSYQNSVFAVKRQRVLALDRQGVYVPLCTRNVFMKYYSKNVENFLIWSQKDQDDYRNSIESTLVEFFRTGEEKE